MWPVDHMGYQAKVQSFSNVKSSPASKDGTRDEALLGPPASSALGFIPPSRES